MGSSRGGRWRVALVAAAAAGSLVGLADASDAGATSGSTATTTVVATTTTSAPLTLAEWKAQYEPAIGQIADDALVAYDTGRKNAAHPSKKKVQATLSDCRQWHRDAQSLPNEVPPIPQASAENTWKALVAASILASSDCTAALQNGSRSATKDFREELLLVNTHERQLAKELGGE